MSILNSPLVKDTKRPGRRSPRAPATVRLKGTLVKVQRSSHGFSLSELPDFRVRSACSQPNHLRCPNARGTLLAHEVLTSRNRPLPFILRLRPANGSANHRTIAVRSLERH